MGCRVQRMLLLVFALLAPPACDGEQSTSCPGPVTARCKWNEATGQFDRACSYRCALPTDAGPCESTASTDDAGARTTYYSNDPRLQPCRD
jgi:hypothetical protein